MAQARTTLTIDEEPDRERSGYERTVAFSDGVCILDRAPPLLRPALRVRCAPRRPQPAVPVARRRRDTIVMNFLVPLLIAVSIPIACLDADAAQWSWLALVVVPRLRRGAGLLGRDAR